MTLEDLQRAGVLAPIDRHLGGLLARMAPEDPPEVALAGALASRALQDGHTCLDLAATVGRPLTDDQGEPVPGFVWPEVDAWLASLAASAVVGDGSGRTPLVLEGGRLWLLRYAHHEQHLADGLARIATTVVPPVDPVRLDASVARLFAGTWAHDEQEAAVRSAVGRGLTVLAGGPGTGKTTTVVRLLAALLEQPHARMPRVLLLAPTGKAAARLSDAMRWQRDQLDLDPDLADRVRAALPVEAKTVHRALGPRNTWMTEVAHHAARPWSEDVIVLDEASMVDLPLMARVVAAVKPGARLVLLGDKDQLAAVGAGAVLADLCAGPLAGPVGQGVVHLVGSRRFAPDSGVGRLAAAVHAADAVAVDAVLDKHDDVCLHRVPGRLDRDAAFLGAAVEGYRAFCQATTPHARLAALDAFRVLAVTRKGASGVEALNVAIQRALVAEGLLEVDGEWYEGRPILVTSNDYGVQLFNGDIGVIARDDHGDLRAFFPTPTEPRAVLPTRLPSHETVFAMTVHKSQGSEFDHVAVALPDADHPLVTRELLYTGITRAKSTVDLWGPRAVLHGALPRTVSRRSGLRDRMERASGGA